MRRNKNDPADRFGFGDDADEELWATRDYFWALKARLLDGHGAQMWRSVPRWLCRPAKWLAG
jgi:hypothetical protein